MSPKLSPNDKNGRNTPKFGKSLPNRKNALNKINKNKNESDSECSLTFERNRDRAKPRFTDCDSSELQDHLFRLTKPFNQKVKKTYKIV